MRAKIIIYSNVFFIIFLLTNPAAFSGSQKPQTVHFVCEDRPSIPLVLGSGEKVPETNPGVAFEIFETIAKELNIKIQYSRFPWKRELKELQENNVDAVFFASFKKSRLEYGSYPMRDGQVDTNKHFIALSYVIYRLKDSSLNWDGKQFNNLSGSIGAPLGYSIVEDLKRMGVSVDPSPERKHDFLKLLKGRVQGVAAQDMFADLFLFFHPDIAKKVEKVMPPLKTKYYYLLLSKNFVNTSPELAQQIWDKIEEKRVEGTIDEFMKKYYTLYPNHWE